MKGWFEKVYSWCTVLADTRWGTWILLIFAFADASIIPLPVTTFFLILTILNPQRTGIFVLLAVSGTFAGAIAGYLTGRLLWVDSNNELTGMAQFLFKFIPGFTSSFFDKAGLLFEKWGFWIFSIASISIIPYGVFSILSGIFGINIIFFSVATLICQVIKFSVIGIVTLKSGPGVKKAIGYS